MKNIFANTQYNREKEDAGYAKIYGFVIIDMSN